MSRQSGRIGSARGSGDFGDWAAAVVLGLSHGTGDGAAGRLVLGMETLSVGGAACVLAAGDTRIKPARGGGIAPQNAGFRLDGQAGFRAAAKRLPRFLARLLATVGVSRGEIGVVIPHPARAEALDHAHALTGFGRAKLVDMFATHGNQIATSIPTALHHAISRGRLTSGRLVLLTCISVGIFVGGAFIRV